MSVFSWFLCFSARVKDHYTNLQLQLIVFKIKSVFFRKWCYFNIRNSEIASYFEKKTSGNDMHARCLLLKFLILKKSFNYKVPNQIKFSLRTMNLRLFSIALPILSKVFCKRDCNFREKDSEAGTDLFYRQKAVLSPILFSC